MAEALFRGIVKAGRFCPDDLQRHGAWLAKLEGRRVIESLRREYAGRTMSQNRYYWGVVLQYLSDWSGYEPEEMHDIMKQLFLEHESRELPNQAPVFIHPSTTTLNVDEFSRFLERVLKWAAEQGIYIPEANA